MGLKNVKTTITFYENVLMLLYKRSGYLGIFAQAIHILRSR